MHVPLYLYLYDYIPLTFSFHLYPMTTPYGDTPRGERKTFRTSLYSKLGSCIKIFSEFSILKIETWPWLLDSFKDVR